MWLFNDSSDNRKAALVLTEIVANKNSLFRAAGTCFLVGLSAVTQAEVSEKPKQNDYLQTRMMEEVFVSSNKLGNADMQELPVSGKLITEQELLDRGVFEFIDFAGSIPSLQFQDLGPGDKEFIIRGVNSSGPSTVGVYFDESPITGSNAQDGGGRNVDIKLIDIETAEIFNGPQGTQYGANSMSGLIRYVPNKPDAYEFSAAVDMDLSTTHEGGENATFSGVVNVPLIPEKLAVRVVAWGTENDGWIDQSRLLGGKKENINDESTTGGRIMFRYMPIDGMVVDLSYLHQSMDLGGSSRYTPKGADYFGTDGNPYPAGVATTDYENTDLGESPWSEDLDLLSLTFSYEFDFGQLTATHSKYKRDIEFSFDASALMFGFGMPFPIGLVQPQVRDVSFSEVRFSSSFDGQFQFFIGVSEREESNDWQSYGVTYDDQGHVTDFVPGPENDFFGNLDFSTFTSTGNVIYQRYVNFDLEQQALFGEMSYEVNDDLTLTGGARYFQSSQKQAEGSIHPVDDGAFVNSPPDDSKVTGKLSAVYQLDQDKNLYATITQGFRVGGINNSESLSGYTEIPGSYSPDFLTNYEIGFKTKIFDESMTLNGSLYHIDWEDMQLELTANSVPYIDNVGSASIDGAELSLSSYFFDNYYFEFAGSYANARLAEDQPGLADDADSDRDRGLKGDGIPNVPSVQAYAALSYTTDVPWGELYLRGDVTYRGSADITFDQDHANSYELPSYSMLSLRASLKTLGDWTTSVYIRNITNEKAEFDAINSQQDPLAVIGAKPRTIGLRIRKEF